MPFKPTERLYRSFAASNFQPVERDSDEGGESYVVRGMFTTFNQFYELLPGFYERVDPHALDEADMSDTIMQYDHSGPVMARKRNGSLRIGIDPDGGWCEADLSGCQQARDLYEAIRNGLVVEMSFGFTIADDGFEWEEDDDGTVRSTITKVSRIYDISAVSIPANPNTEISARSYVDAAIEARKKLKESDDAESDAVVDEETRSSQAENSIEDVTVTVDGVSYEGVEDVTARSYKGLTVEAVVEGFDIEDMATRIASILAERSVKEVSEQIREELSEPEQEEPEPVSDSKARRMRRARALQLSHI